jgi:hypothetical protein
VKADQLREDQEKVAHGKLKLQNMMASLSVIFPS